MLILYGTGRDSLRCLALATIDEPRKKEDMNLTDASQFIHYEVTIEFRSSRSVRIMLCLH